MIPARCRETGKLKKYLCFLIAQVTLAATPMVTLGYTLTYLPLLPHICISESGQHWFIWWLGAYSASGLLSIGPLGTNFSKILIKIKKDHQRNCIWKCRLWNGNHFVQGVWVNWFSGKTHLFYILIYAHNVTNHPLHTTSAIVIQKRGTSVWNLWADMETLGLAPAILIFLTLFPDFSFMRLDPDTYHGSWDKNNILPPGSKSIFGRIKRVSDVLVQECQPIYRNGVG